MLPHAGGVNLRPRPDLRVVAVIVVVVLLLLLWLYDSKVQAIIAAVDNDCS